MASTIATTCACGKVFYFYITKQKLFGEIMGDDNEDWEVVDAEEEAAGEIELAQQLAATADGVFVDSRESEVTTCPECDEEIIFMEFFSHLKKMVQAALSQIGTS
jgi:hypothetical protein